MNLYLDGTPLLIVGGVFVFDKQSLLAGGNGNPIAYRGLSNASNIFAPMALIILIAILHLVMLLVLIRQMVLSLSYMR